MRGGGGREWSIGCTASEQVEQRAARQHAANEKGDDDK